MQNPAAVSGNGDALKKNRQEISPIFSGWDELPNRMYKILEKHIAFL